MFTLGWGMFNEFVKKPEYFILILGIDGAGKTTFADCFKSNFDKKNVRRPPSKIVSTVGLNLVKVECCQAVLNLWDVGGQRELRGIWNSYIEDCHVLIFVVDASTMERVEEALECLDGTLNIKRTSSIPLLILLNKCELHKRNGTVNIGEEEKEEAHASTGINNGCDWKEGDADVAEQIRLKLYQNCHVTARSDVAIFSISALDNLNIQKCALWVLNTLAESQK